jgi:TonB family protein
MFSFSRHRLIAMALVTEACLFGVLVTVNGQRTTLAPDEVAPAIALYQSGQYDEAIQILRELVKRDKNHLRAWHYLGLAWEHKSKPNDARKAHEKAAKLGDALLQSQLNLVERDEDVRRLLLPWRTELSEAGESAGKYLTLSVKPSKSKTEEWSARGDSLLGFADIANEQSPAGIKPKDADVKARILRKPEALYTEEARRNGVRGLVVLKVIFSATGRVLGIRVVKGLPSGLTGEAIRAASRIKFIPAQKDGKPVSMFAQLEYTFSIY